MTRRSLFAALVGLPSVYAQAYIPEGEVPLTDIGVAAVPEPSTAVLVALGVAALIWWRRR